MAVNQDRESFIPYRRSDLIQLCLEDGQLAGEDVQKFREFCEIISGYYHFQLHHQLELLKDNYAPFDPDIDTKSITAPTTQEQAEMAARTIGEFEAILKKANYRPISEEKLEQAFAEASLIEVDTEVDFNDFDQLACYYRGETKQIRWVKRLLLNQVEQEVEVLERVALLLKFKDAAYFAAKQAQKKEKKKKLNFTPGKMYVYIYKNIPKYDLEFLFPNVKTSMTLKDRIMLSIPAIGAAIPILLKVVPQLLLIVWFILFLTGWTVSFENLNITEEEINSIKSILIATLSLLVALGGFGFKQYTNYKNRQIKFKKNVTDTLFFRSLASNLGVFQFLIDAAEEEECKEIILVYYHLIDSKEPLSIEQLDDRIEQWMEDKFGTKIDFDINKTLSNLLAIRGKIVKSGADAGSTQSVALVSCDSDGCYQNLSLDDALQVIDYVWDNAFEYNR